MAEITADGIRAGGAPVPVPVADPPSHAAAAAASSGDGEGSVRPEGRLDESDMALEGITMLLNNEWKEAQEYFAKYKDHSPLMCAGSSFVTFMEALMTFEDEKLAEAMKAMQETEKRCRENKGFGHKLKPKSKKHESKHSMANIEDRLQRKVIVGDCILYQAILTFINQDLPSMVRGGWYLRKAYKIYEKAYKEIKILCDKVGASGALTADKHPPQMSEILFPASESAADLEGMEAGLPADDVAANDSISLNSSDLQNAEVSPETAARLLGSVCFGYGSFQLCISLMPPKILKVIQFLGFEGDRFGGLEALDIASNSKDMKAPLATMTLVWYHTVIRPFFALDGNNITAGVEQATVIIERCAEQYPKSALYLFFRGRILRLKAEVDEALTTYNLALEQCANQRETQLICHYEIGWLNMMTLNWSESLRSFMRLKQESRWSKCYYTYLTALCQGAMGDVKGAQCMLKDVPGLVKRKNNQIEAFVLRRAEQFKKLQLSQEHACLLALEVLYLWNAIPTCRKSDLEKMLHVCSSQEEKSVYHLRSLIEGAIHRELDNEDLAIQYFKEAIARHHGMKEDYHVAAYAAYELGTICSGKPETFQQAKDYFKKAKETHKDYDFDNRLNVRINAALKRLKQDGTPV